MKYVLTQAAGVASPSIAKSPASMIHWVAEANGLRQALPAEVQDTLQPREAAGPIDSAESQSAMMQFYRGYVICLDPVPDPVARTFANTERTPQVYWTMNRPSEFDVVGNLKDWGSVARLPEIAAPALVAPGRHDEATPLIVGKVHQGIRSPKRVIFEHGAHVAHIKEAERYMVLRDALFRATMHADVSPRRRCNVRAPAATDTHRGGCA